MLTSIKRVYDKRNAADGKRILVDRLWPRGIKKSTQGIDFWMKDVAPSTELRKWFAHDPAKWEEFRDRYRKELEGGRTLASLVGMAKRETITLVYSAKDTEHNNAVVLAELVNELSA